MFQAKRMLFWRWRPSSEFTLDQGETLFDFILAAQGDFPRASRYPVLPLVMAQADVGVGAAERVHGFFEEIHGMKYL